LAPNTFFAKGSYEPVSAKLDVAIPKQFASPEEETKAAMISAGIKIMMWSVIAISFVMSLLHV